MDPHTAVAWRAYEKYRLVSSDDTYCIVLSTASPYKFSDVVLEAAGMRRTLNWSRLTVCVSCML